MVKFTDLKKGVKYTYSDFSEDGLTMYSRNPNMNFEAAVARFNIYKNMPFTVVKRDEEDLDAPFGYKVRFDDGTLTYLREPVFGSSKFTMLGMPEEVLDEVKHAPKFSAVKAKDVTMGELKAMPGAVDYEKAAANWPGKPGGKRHTRKRRGKKHVRGTSKRIR